MPTRRRNVSTLGLAFALAAAAAASPARAQTAAPPPVPPMPAGSTPEVAPTPDLGPPTYVRPGPPVAMPPAVPQPTIDDVAKRSGVVGRMTPINPHLPPDPRRDQWYDTRWGDPPNRGKHPNFYRNGGLYGIPWKTNHTASIYPYFYGAPGENTLRGDERKPGYFARLPQMLLHPFKPVGMYYDQGTYVPVYDLDPLVPGPSPWPYPFYRRLTNWGG